MSVGSVGGCQLGGWVDVGWEGGWMSAGDVGVSRWSWGFIKFETYTFVITSTYTVYNASLVR